MAKIKGMNHITLSVIDLSLSIDFYHQVLGMKLLVRWHKGAYLLAGDLWVCLAKANHSFPKSEDDYTHYAWSVNPEDFASLSKSIIDSGATIFQDNSSPGDSLYFLDPDGHKLEIHTGDLEDRILTKKHCPGSWEDVQWYI